MSAVLAGGQRALLSHRALAHHLALLSGDGPRVIDVTVAGRSHATRPGIRFHQPQHITRGEITVVRDVPCTTVERLLVDMAAVATATELATLVHRAQIRSLLDTGRLAVQLARRAKGVPQLRELIEPSGPDLRAQFEKRFHRFVRRGRWPGYEPNVRLETPFGPLRLDAYWREFGFGLELDSWAHHQNRDAFERDRQRVLRRRRDRRRRQTRHLADVRDLGNAREPARPPPARSVTAPGPSSVSR